MYRKNAFIYLNLESDAYALMLMVKNSQIEYSVTQILMKQLYQPLLCILEIQLNAFFIQSSIHLCSLVYVHQ